MIRLHVICEGPTEEAFVTNLLRDKLEPKGIILAASQIGRPGKKGGGVTWRRVLRDLRILLKNDSTVYCTTFFDSYGIEPTFPGKDASIKAGTDMEDPTNYLEIMQDAFHAAFLKGVESELGHQCASRFIPYIQFHEFEGLLFSDPARLADSLEKPSLSAKFKEIRKSFITPEHINDSKTTAPSKRIIRLFEPYKKSKPLYGVSAAQDIGLNTIMQECPLFANWVETLLNLTASSHE